MIQLFPSTSLWSINLYHPSTWPRSIRVPGRVWLTDHEWSWISKSPKKVASPWGTHFKIRWVSPFHSYGIPIYRTCPKKIAPFIAEKCEMRIFLDMPGALPRRRLLENHLQGVLACLYVQLHNKNKQHNKKTTSVVPSNSFNIWIMILFHNKKQPRKTESPLQVASADPTTPDAIWMLLLGR